MIQELAKTVFQEKCPVCKKGEVYQSKGNLLLLKIPKMNENCPNCNHRFEKEPGYFVGAMYVSYGLCIAEMIIFFILGRLVGIPVDYIIYVLIAVILILWTFNFRVSRIIWMFLI